MRSRDRVSIGWISPGQVDALFAASLFQLGRMRSDRIETLLVVEGSAQVPKARNEVVAQFLARTTSDWLLMIDSDEQLPVAAFDKLISVAHDTERPLVSGLVFAAFRGDLYPTPIPTMYRLTDEGYLAVHDYPADKVIEVDSVGGGCILVHRSVLERIRENASDDEGTDWCWFGSGPVGGKWVGEDFIFCSRVRDLGFPLHVHTGAVLPHRKSFWLDDRHHAVARSTSL